MRLAASNISPQDRDWDRSQDQYASCDVSKIREEVDTLVYDRCGGVVQSGPFTGMKLRRTPPARHTHLAPMVLGCYEEELHGALEQQIARVSRLTGTPHVAVVGAGEGYYAVGLKRRLPDAVVYAVEPDDTLAELVRLNASDNGVEIKVGVDVGQMLSAVDLVVMDCEGAEVSYLDLDRFPGLVPAHVIVEVHNYPNQKSDDILIERFRATHRIDMVIEGPRNPNMFKVICGLPSTYRWSAVDEGRPCLMGWFVMRPRGWVMA